MAIIEGFRVQNYRVLKDVTLGRLWNLQGKGPLTPLVVVIGKNGTGKSTLFDALGFLADALRVGVEVSSFFGELVFELFFSGCSKKSSYGRSTKASKYSWR